MRLSDPSEDRCRSASAQSGHQGSLSNSPSGSMKQRPAAKSRHARNRSRARQPNKTTERTVASSASPEEQARSSLAV
jgi:hypothetical protein